jgi:glutamine synthetase
MDLTDVERFLTSVDTVECCFPDTWGTFVGRRMPAASFRRAAHEGLSMPNAAFAWNLTGDIAPTPFASADTGFPNMHVQPDLDTLRAAPWAERTAFCLMDAYEERGGAPHPMSTRAMLRRAEADLGDLGYEAWVAPELEFYLCTEDWQPVSQDHRCWSMTRGDEAEPIVGEIRAALLGAGVPVESSQTEGGPGQLEINVGPSAPLDAADNAALLKYVVKLVARRHGLRATFMPMPFQGQEGSGHHLHESLRRKGSEENVFASDDAVFEAYLAGMLEHMVELTAVNLPGVNAYKRLRDYTFAPNRVSWGLDNRSVAVRIPSGDPAARRLEIRTASADANPYLIVATTLSSGADGIARGLTPPKPTEGDAYLDGSLERLPATLGEAVDRLEQSAFCRERLGDLFVETYALVCRREETAYREHVSAWERERYLEHA